MRSQSARPSQAARFKAEIHFNPALLSEKYLAAHDNLKGVFTTCQLVTTRRDIRRDMLPRWRPVMAPRDSRRDIRRDVPQVRSEDDARRMFERYGGFFLATLSIEVSANYRRIHEKKEPTSRPWARDRLRRDYDLITM